MTYVLVVVVLALALPWGGAAVATRLADRLPPRWACWGLTGASVLLAGGTVSALVGLFHVPFLASLERLSLTRVLEEWPTAVPFACAAGAVMVAQLVLLVRRWIQHRGVLSRAWRAADEGTSDGDVLVVPGTDVDAFALPGYRGRRGRVVVTAAMVRSLKAGEREVLLAHERAHLAGRHHLLSAVVDLAAVVHPAMRGLREALAFHLERWADEAAAAAVGDRRAAAAAVARAALAKSAHGRVARYPLLSATSGPVPRRVQALLLPEPAAPRGGARRAGVVALAGAVVVAALAALALAYGLHEYVEYAARQLIGAPSGRTVR
ncbi:MULTISPECIES: M48 family metalloprotease [Streptomyces]|uniref:M48 family metalloprotease n=1 Tax=Streptomyces TaxID=1883 RepID=UPI00081B4CF2|nr:MULTISPECIES: M48 family metalloprotease [unclassified Streptomyces]MYQ55228.1 M48 family metalloprotease [Streptomyces sp. SID4941]SCE34615.1 Peptidase family M48 [Streptomyces sp. PalvLS-984]SDD19441.1 Antirepressor regulating drug resistance, predicted signal transduction N-terminal membrane component [Streptomyces sp. AmelKG-A3]